MRIKKTPVSAEERSNLMGEFIEGESDRLTDLDEYAKLVYFVGNFAYYGQEPAPRRRKLFGLI